MPSLSTLLKRSKKKPKSPDDTTQSGEAVQAAQFAVAQERGKDEVKVQRRQSVFRSFLGRTRSEDTRVESSSRSTAAVRFPAAANFRYVNEYYSL